MSKKRGPKPCLPGERRDSVVSVGCRTDWKDWLERFAHIERTEPSHLIDQALAALARARHFDEPPER
jgi:hypothetical protein